MSNKIDKILIEKFVDGNKLAFEELFKKYGKVVLGIALRYMKNQSDAESVAQDIWIKVYKNLKNFKGNSSFKTWLYRVSVNQCLTVLKSKKRKECDNIEDFSIEFKHKDFLEELDEIERKKILLNGINTLPKKQKAIVELRINDEMPFKEIAVIMKSSVSSAKSNFSFAMKSLKNYVEKITNAGNISLHPIEK